MRGSWAFSLASYEYDELLDELSGQASDGWGEGFEQHEIHTSEGDIYVSFYDTCGAWELVPEEEYINEKTEDSKFKNLSLLSYKETVGFYKNCGFEKDDDAVAMFFNH